MRQPIGVIMMKMIVIMLGYLSGVLSEVDLPRVVDGEIFTGIQNKSYECQFQVNKEIYVTDLERLPGQHYGLVKYNCSNATGILLSKFTECKNCSFVCQYNEKITFCQSFYLSGFIGIICGFIPLIGCWVVYKINQRAKRGNGLRTSSISDMLELEGVSRPNVATAVLIILLGLPLVLTCDQTVVLGSSVKTCGSEGCITSQVSLMSLMDGMSVCLVGINGGVMKIKLDGIQEVFRYTPIYMTSSFSVESESVSECKIVGSSCWNPETTGTCSDHAKDSPFRDQIGKLEKMGQVYGTSCTVSPLGCDYWCFHKVACTWTLWWLKPRHPMYTVYKKLHRSLRAEVILYENDKLPTREILSIEDPTADGQNFLSIMNINLVEEMVADKLLLVNGLAYLVDGSELDQPLPYTLGDFQIQLMGNMSIFPKGNVQCKSYGCKSQCSGPASFISGFNLETRTPLPVSTLSSGLLEAAVRRKGFVGIAINTQKIEHILVKQASCDLSVVFAQGCSGCIQATPIIFQALNVLEEGVLHFKSGCSFESYVVPCQSDLTSVHLYGNPKECHLYFPSINKTILIRPDYIFVGNLSSKEVWISESQSGVGGGLRLLLANEGFLTGLASSFTMGVVGTLLVSLGMKCASFWAGRRLSQAISAQ